MVQASRDTYQVSPDRTILGYAQQTADDCQPSPADGSIHVMFHKPGLQVQLHGWSKRGIAYCLLDAVSSIAKAQ